MIDILNYYINIIGSLVITYYTLYFVLWGGIKVLDKWIELDRVKEGTRR